MAASVLVLVGLTTASAHAQGTWTQSEFVVGTWIDPSAVTGGDSTSWKRALAQARDAHFNLFTGLPENYQFNTPLLSLADRFGIHVLVADNEYFHTGGVQNPVFDSSAPARVLAKYDALSADQQAAVWGWTLYEEPLNVAATASYIGDWAAAMHGLVPGSAAYVNLTPGCCRITAEGDTICDCYPDYAHLILSDPLVARRPDVASTDLYPFTLQDGQLTYAVTYFRTMGWIRQEIGARPFWIISLVAERLPHEIINAMMPDENQLRYMAFCPTAAGAKGIIWFTYRDPDCTDASCTYDAVVRDLSIPTCKYYQLEPINRFLRTVVGPVAMNSTHLGLFHQSTAPSGESVTLLSAQGSNNDCPVVSLSDGSLGSGKLAVGVFRPTVEPGDYYLLVVNKGLTAATGNVQLKNSYAVSRSPSVIGYAGGTGYEPVGTGMSFSIQLQGGEGRLYHLTSAPTSDIALISPQGGDGWSPGQTRTVTWQSNGMPVDALLYADQLPLGDDVSGPVAVLATGLTGSQANLTVPAGFLSHRARLVLRATDGNGVVHDATSRLEFSTVPGSAPAATVWGFGSLKCFTSSSLCLDGSGNPRLSWYDHGLCRYAALDGGAWTQEGVYADVSFSGMLRGVHNSVVLDSQNQPNILYLDGRETGGSGVMLVHARRTANGSWTGTAVDGGVLDDGNLGDVSGNLALARAPNGDLVVAYNAGIGRARHLRVRSYTGTAWSPALDIAAGNPQSIDLAIDAAGNRWIAFVDEVTGLERLRVLKVTAANTWTTWWYISTPTGKFSQVSLALNSSGSPRIAYTWDTPDGGQQLYYRTLDAAPWPAAQLVDGSPQTISGLSLALQGDSARVAYAGNGVIKYASQAGTTWSVAPLDDTDDADGPVRLKFTAGGEHWVTFLDRSLDQVKVIGPPPSGLPCGGYPDPCDPGGIILHSIRIQGPNPLLRGGALTIEFSTPRPAELRLALFDVAGRRVASQSFGRLSPGTHRLPWRLNQVEPGVYFVRSWSGEQVFSSGRVVVVR